jgi:hypothetical protein
MKGTPWYAFNDLHGVIALAGAGRHEDIRTFLADRERWLQTAAGSNARMTADIGLPASRALLAFVDERYDDVIDQLWPIRRTLAEFGGSHAQRDALQRTLLEAALRSGRYELARALTSERLGVRGSSVYGWSQRARALRGLDDASGAADAEQRATTYRTQFADSQH